MKTPLPLLAAMVAVLAAACEAPAGDHALDADLRVRRRPPQDVPPASPLPGSGTLGYVGCSMTMAGRDGYVQAGGARPIWPLLQGYGGGSPEVWAKDTSSASRYWAAFDAALSQAPDTSALWWQLCALSNDASDLRAAKTVLAELHRRAPGLPIYVSAQPSYSPGDHVCSIAGADGPARMAALVEQVLALGDPLVVRGPSLAPLAFPAETKSDGCHPNTAGTLTTGQQLVAFFDGPAAPGRDGGVPLPSDGGTPGNLGDRARGIYVVDDGDADFATALAQPFVDGALVRAGWSTLEPTEGSYNFSALCSKVTAAHAAGKKVTLANFAKAPGWVLSQLPASEQWTHPQYGAQPVPWSRVAQQKLQAFAEAEANFACGGYKLKEHPAIAQVDTPILGMQSVRHAPSYTLSQLSDAVRVSVDVWYAAFGPGHHFYVGLFPLGSSTADAIAIRDAVQADHPAHHWFQETWTGSGPSGTLATPLEPNVGTRRFHVMLQACGYWSDQARLPCNFAGSSDTPQAGYDNVAADFQAKYLELYPDDLNHAAYRAMLQSLHDQVWR